MRNVTKLLFKSLLHEGLPVCPCDFVEVCVPVHSIKKNSTGCCECLIFQASTNRIVGGDKSRI